MIRFVRTSSIAPGKLGNALAFARQISEYVGKQYGVEMQLMMPVGGNPHRIAWRAEYANLGAMEEHQSKLMVDPKYIEILAKGGENFIAGSINDAIWRVI